MLETFESVILKDGQVHGTQRKTMLTVSKGILGVPLELHFHRESVDSLTQEKENV